jgi:DNA modification methylase
MAVIHQTITDRYAIYHADCMEVLPTFPSESIDLSVYSPPFPELYQYSDDPRDITNCVSYDESIKHYRFAVEQIARLTRPGRLSCVHCTDLKQGQIFQRDFPGDVIRLHEEAGMKYFCRITIWKDAWEFARRTRMKTLMHKTLVADAADTRIAPGDFVVVFKKPGVNSKPILHVDGFQHYAGTKTIPARLREYVGWKGNQRENELSHWIYRQYASPVWMDIDRGSLMPFDESKENPEERHVCPLQRDVIERCLVLWSNPGDIVLTPFAGVGSEVFMSVRMGRRAIGCELKATYYRQACKNMKAVDALDSDHLEFELGNGETHESSAEESHQQSMF